MCNTKEQLNECITKIAEIAANDIQKQYPKVDYLSSTVSIAVVDAAHSVLKPDKQSLIDGFEMTGSYDWRKGMDTVIAIIRVTFKPTGQYVDLPFNVPNDLITYSETCKFDPPTIGFEMTGWQEWSDKDKKNITIIRVTFKQSIDEGFNIPVK
jgi:hypothetical protein